MVSKSKKVMKPDEAVWIPQAEALDNLWAPKPLSVQGTIRLLSLLSRLATQGLSMPGRDFTWAGLLQMITSLDEKDIIELLSIITHQSADSVRANFRLGKALKALVDWWRSEELDELLTLFSQGGEVPLEAVSSG